MPKLDVISREEWGARPPLARTPVTWPEGVDLWVHHSDGANMQPTATFADEAATVRAIQAFHMGPSRGWNDVGYAYLVAPSGRVYEGRGHAIGAHSPGKNHEPSVCMLGTYQTAAPGVFMHIGVYQLADAINAGDLRGHRENTATGCPGDRGMAVIVNGPPPPGFGKDFDQHSPPATLRQRLRGAGFGPNSIDVILARLRAGYVGTIPNPTDRVTFRRLRDAGFVVASSRAIVRTLRRKPDQL